MLRVTKLKGAEYLINGVADGVEDYYMGIGEAPGVWRGRWAAELGLEGVVAADDLRALVDGHDPATGEDWLAGHRDRKVRAIDVTMSVPKSVSVLWALGTEATAAEVSLAVVEATDVALGFMEEHAAFAREQVDGCRRRVDTSGFAIATFAHRVSRDGDPYLHNHCFIPNVVRREGGDHVAFDANPLHIWNKAVGTVFLNHLQGLLTQRLGVAWGPERNGSREMVGFSSEQLRAFSKRTVAIETRLEANGELVFDSKAERMRADERASLATRARKDKALTPELLRQRWITEAEQVGLHPGAGVDDLVIGRQMERGAPVSDAELAAALVDPNTGICATESKFCEAHVVERIAAISGGRMSLDEVVEASKRFLASDLIVRLTPDAERRRPPEWSTVELRAVEDRLLARLSSLTARTVEPVASKVIDAAIAAEAKQLGEDQVAAVHMLCGAGSSVRALVAPAGFGKTTALHAAAVAAQNAGREVVVLAPTHKAVAELRAVGLEAQTIARFRRNLAEVRLTMGATVIVDETSQLGTRDAAALLDAVGTTPCAQVWFVGDARQAQSVAAGGIAVELERLGAEGAIPSAGLEVNRRQQHPAERKALAKFRAGEVEESQKIRTDHGWEHEAATPADTRHGLAAAAVADSDRHGAEHVAVLAISHTDCEDLADRIRAIRTARGELRGPTIEGPSWGPHPRTYAAGDRILVHANVGSGSERAVFNGSTGTVLAVSTNGLAVLLDSGNQVMLDNSLVAGRRPDGSPNLSHAWARTVDGSQGGTWRQVNLLGTPALDRYRGYVGQSRGQDPTHTWNTRPDAEHPLSLLADERTPAEAVLDALRRDEPKVFAAWDDPSLFDRKLQAERDEHAAVIATRPPDRRNDLKLAVKERENAVQERHSAVRGLIHREDERARLSPLTRLRRGGGADIARAEEALAGAHRRLECAEHDVTEASHTAAGLERAVAERAAWDRTNGWRLDRVAEIDDALAHHWAEVSLSAVRADDPLAFGVERLRAARTTYRKDLDRLIKGLPPDRRDALAGVQADLRRQEEMLRHAERQTRGARAALDRAGERRWGRRDKEAIGQADRELLDAKESRERCTGAVAEAQQRVGKEGEAVRTWAHATKMSADERSRLTRAVNDLDDALVDTRAQRVAAAAIDPTSELWQSLGPPPGTRGGLAAWCGIAERLDTWTDRRSSTMTSPLDRFAPRSHPLLGPRPSASAAREWDAISTLLAHSAELVQSASRRDPGPPGRLLEDQDLWQPAVDAATESIQVEHRTRAITHGSGIER